MDTPPTPTSTDDPDRRVLVTLFKTPSHQPTSIDTGVTGQWYAFPSRYVVDLHTDLAEGRRTTTMHGRWFTREQAQRFAWSAPGPNEVREVPEYWYAPAFGKVDVSLDPNAYELRADGAPVPWLMNVGTVREAYAALDGFAPRSLNLKVLRSRDGQEMPRDYAATP